ARMCFAITRYWGGAKQSVTCGKTAAESAGGGVVGERAGIARVAHAVAVGVRLLAAVDGADGVEHLGAVVAGVGDAVAVGVARRGRAGVDRRAAHRLWARRRAGRLARRRAAEERRVVAGAGGRLQLRVGGVELFGQADRLHRAAHGDRVAAREAERADDR